MLTGAEQMQVRYREVEGRGGAAVDQRTTLILACMRKYL